MATEAKGKRRAHDASPVEKLPDEIIQQILSAADPNGFASLVLLNRKWRAASQRAHLYLQHLEQCPSLTAPSQPALPPADDKNLPKLRQLFARQVKRNLFDAYLRPRETLIKLVSNSISSSSCPGGEGMQFNTSPRSQLLLAYNSSRIYIIDVRGETAEVKREFKIIRRPVAVCVKDDASLLAVLSSEMQVDIYDLQVSPPRRKQAIILNNTPRTIALSPCGSVLAAAYEGGIEVSSLNPTGLPSESRSVKCDAVDTLAFSYDGTQILGTTTNSSPPSTVILTAPYYDPGNLLADDGISAMWTTSILFPNSSRDCSHAVLLQDGSAEEASWTFTYDRSFETFRAVRIDDLRNGTTYFTGPVPEAASQAKMLPSTLSAATYHGELVAAGFHRKEVWIYGIPNDLDAVPETPSSGSDRNSSSNGLGRNGSERSNASRQPPSRGPDTGNGRVPQWQLLCDKLRNTLVPGFKVSELSGVSTVKWVANFSDNPLKERLVVTAKGVNGPRLVTEEEDIDFVDGGRVTLLDFSYDIANGQKNEMTIEVGTDEAEALEEERRDMETEVAIVRRRTVAQKHGGRSALLRAATTASRDVPAVPPVPSMPSMPGTSTEDTNDDDDPLMPRKIGLNPARNIANDGPDDEEFATMEEQEAMESPYSHASPRSAPTLRRAATAAAVNQRLNPRLADGRPIEYRRADGRREHPHESDADNWVPPPPPYQKEDPGDLPAFLSGPAVTPMGAPPVPPLPAMPALTSLQKARAQPGRPTNHSSPDLLDQIRESGVPSRASRRHQRTASDSTTMSRPHAGNTPRPMSSPSARVVDMDDLYDVTPPQSPPPQIVSSQTESRQVSNSTMTPTEASPPSLQHSGQTVPSEASVRDAAPISSPVISRQEPARPALSVQVPQSPTETAPSHHSQAPRMRSLSNAQTWPAGLEQGPPHPMSHAAEAPYSAPHQNMSVGHFPMPPPPSVDQMASLNRRASQGIPQRLSGGWYDQQHLPGSWTGQEVHPHSAHPAAPASISTWPTSPEQPLIISTPRGVAGAFDPPDRRASNRRNDMPIMAPVPRHPRQANGSGSRPTVERLETIYSVAPSQQSQPRQGRRLMPRWRRSPSVSPGAVAVGVNRQTSRAERGAAKNIKDAKKKGWDPQKNRKKKKKRKDYDMASSAGWTDISTTSAIKERFQEKKCLVM